MLRYLSCIACVTILLMYGTAMPQSKSDHMLIPRLVVKNPPIPELNKSFTEYYWNTQLFINCYSGATSYIMTPSHELLSGMFFHLDNAWNRLMYGESTANWIRAYGSRGSDAGNFLWPDAVDAHGLCNADGYLPYYYIYVLDTQNDRIAELRYNWQTEVMEWNNSFTLDSLSGYITLTLNNGGTFLEKNDDYLWVIDRCYLKRFTLDGTLQNTYGAFGKPGGVGTFQVLSSVVCGRSDDLPPPQDIFANNDYIYAADPRNSRIVWLEKSATSEDITWRGAVSLEADIVNLEVDNFGHVWAVDRKGGRIYKYTYDLFPLAYYGDLGYGEGQLWRPYCIYTHGGYQGCGNMAINEVWTDSTGIKYFASGTDILDFSIDGSDNHRWHYIRYVLIEPSHVTVEIHGGPQKQFVKTIREGTEWSGQSLYVWNGQKENGEPADSGWYSVIVFDTSLYTDIETGEPTNTVQLDMWFYHAKNPYVDYIPGDVNDDGNVNVADAVYLINYIFKGGPEPQPYLCVGDANADGSVNVGDVIHLVNFVFKGLEAPRDGCVIAL